MLIAKKNNIFGNIVEKMDTQFLPIVKLNIVNIIAISDLNKNVLKVCHNS